MRVRWVATQLRKFRVSAPTWSQGENDDLGRYRNYRRGFCCRVDCAHAPAGAPESTRFPPDDSARHSERARMESSVAPTLSWETISAEIGTQTEFCSPTSVASPYARDAAVEQRSTKRPGWMADVYRRLVEEGGVAALEPASPIGANLR